MKGGQPHWSNFPSLPACSLLWPSAATREVPISEMQEQREQSFPLTPAPAVGRRTSEELIGACSFVPFILETHQGGASSARADIWTCQGSSSKGFLPGCREGFGCRPGGPEIYPFAPRLMINRSLPSPRLAGEPRARLGQEEPDSICLCSEVLEIGSTLGWLHLMDLESTGTFWGHLGPGQNPRSPWGSVASSQKSRLGQAAPSGRAVASAPWGVGLSRNGIHSARAEGPQGTGSERGDHFRELLGKGEASSHGSPCLAALLLYGSDQSLPLPKTLFPCLDKGKICPGERIKHLARGKNFEILQPAQR